MKTLAFILLFIVASVTSNAQRLISEKRATEEKIEIKTTDANYLKQIDRMIYCMDKYSKEKNMAASMEIIGGVFMFMSTRQDEKEAKDIFMYGGGALALAGIIVGLDAEKWMNKRKLVIKGNGLAYRF